MPLSLVLIDDHRLFREALAALLAKRDELAVVGTAGDAESALEVVTRLRPQVAVLDLVLRESDATGLIPEILARSPQTRVLLLTAVADANRAAACIGMGAHGYALKGQSASEIIAALQAVARGERYVVPSLARSVDDLRTHRQASPSAPPIAELSPREREIFDLAVRGASNGDISRALQISIKTVETHRSNINRKLDLHSPADLVRFAARWGLIASAS